MWLKDWMRREGVSDAAMAERIGAVSAETVRKLRFRNAAQRRVIPDLQGRGFPVFVVDTVEDAVQALSEAGFGPPRPPAFLTRETGGF